MTIACAALAAARGAFAWLSISDGMLASDPERPGDPRLPASTDYSCLVAGPPRQRAPTTDHEHEHTTLTWLRSAAGASHPEPQGSGA